MAVLQFEVFWTGKMGCWLLIEWLSHWHVGDAKSHILSTFAGVGGTISDLHELLIAGVLFL